MDIYGINGAATIAIACSALFVLVARSWQGLSRAIGMHHGFADGLMREAAQRFRDQFERLSSKQSTYLGACIVFLVLFVAAYDLDAKRLFLGYPLWQLYMLLVALLACILLSAQQLVLTSLECHRVRLLRDTNIAIGHRVQRIAAGFGRVYHDVETAAGVIDHVIVSASGVYAINVVVKRPVTGGTVSLQGTDLLFSPAGDTATIVPMAAAIAALEREFRRLLDHRVRVRSIIAVPGWEIADQPGEEHLLANATSLSMLRGWKDKNDHLMNEDADALHALLTSRCSLRPAPRRTVRSDQGRETGLE
jgi:hypothetical protein